MTPAYQRTFEMALSLKFSVRTKILSGFVLVFILFLSVLVYVLVQMRQIQWQLSIVEQGYLPLTRDVAQLENNQQGMERYLDPDRLITRDRVPTSLYRPLALFHLGRIDESLHKGRTRIEETLAMPGVEMERRYLTIIRSQFEKIETNQRAYSVLARNLLALIEAGDMDAARSKLPDLKEQTVKVSRSVRALNQMLEQRMEAAVEQTQATQQRAALVVGGLSTAAILFGLVMIFVTHLVLRPISRLIEGVRFIAGGDYQQRVAIEAEDEIGTLAREFNVMATSLQARDRSLKQSREDLTEAYEELQRAHQELKTLSLYNENIIHSIGVGLIVCDRDERITTVNPAAVTMWGIQWPDMQETKVGEVAALQSVMALPHEVLETGKIIRREAVALLQKDGSSRLLDCAFVPLVDDQKAVQGIILLSEDVTERTRTKQRLIQSERLALIGRMSAQVTHEIRNPLNALGLNTELLGDEIAALDPNHGSDAWALLRSVTQEIDRVTAVTDSYLRLARLPTPHLEREDVGEIIQSLLRFLGEEFATKGIQLSFEVEEGLPEALVDENQLRQALLNIIRNSSEAMEAGGQLEIRVAGRDDAVEMLLRDDGEGIEPAIMGRIFDPFYSTKSQGTGLGLPITHQIIVEHGGSLTCESVPGEGTTFRIRLPIAEATAPRSWEEEPPPFEGDLESDPERAWTAIGRSG